MTLKPSDNFNPWISFKKFLTGLGYALVPFLLSYAIGFLETEEFPPEYSGLIVLMIGILHCFSNAWKHWND